MIKISRLQIFVYTLTVLVAGGSLFTMERVFSQSSFSIQSSTKNISIVISERKTINFTVKEDGRGKAGVRLNISAKGLDTDIKNNGITTGGGRASVVIVGSKSGRYEVRAAVADDPSVFLNIVVKVVDIPVDLSVKTPRIEEFGGKQSLKVNVCARASKKTFKNLHFSVLVESGIGNEKQTITTYNSAVEIGSCKARSVDLHDLATGKHVLVVTVDPSNKIDESNEKNNIASTTVTLKNKNKLGFAIIAKQKMFKLIPDDVQEVDVSVKDSGGHVAKKVYLSLNLSGTSGGSLLSDSVRTDDRGLARIQYTAGKRDGVDNLVVTAQEGISNATKIVFDVRQSRVITKARRNANTNITESTKEGVGFVARTDRGREKSPSRQMGGNTGGSIMPGAYQEALKNVHIKMQEKARRKFSAHGLIASEGGRSGGVVHDGATRRAVSRGDKKQALSQASSLRGAAGRLGDKSDGGARHYANTDLIQNNQHTAAKIDLTSAVDSDGDGLTDGVERSLQLNFKIADTDGDGYNDFKEIKNGFSPRMGRGAKLYDDLDEVPWARKYVIALYQHGVFMGGARDRDINYGMAVRKSEVMNLMKKILAGNDENIDERGGRDYITQVDAVKMILDYLGENRELAVNDDGGYMKRAVTLGYIKSLHLDTMHNYLRRAELAKLLSKAAGL